MEDARVKTILEGRKIAQQIEEQKEATIKGLELKNRQRTGEIWDKINELEREKRQIEQETTTQKESVKEKASEREEKASKPEREYEKECRLANFKDYLRQNPQRTIEGFEILKDTPLIKVVAQLNKNDKPKNCVSLEIVGEIATTKISDFYGLKYLHSWRFKRRQDLGIASKDFPNEEKAKAYYSRNKERLTKKFFEKIDRIEQEISQAKDIEDLIDFRLFPEIIDVHYARSPNYKVIKKERHKATLHSINSFGETKKGKPFEIEWLGDYQIRTNTKNEKELEDLKHYFTSSIFGFVYGFVYNRGLCLQ